MLAINSNQNHPVLSGPAGVAFGDEDKRCCIISQMVSQMLLNVAEC